MVILAAPISEYCEPEIRFCAPASVPVVALERAPSAPVTRMSACSVRLLITLAGFADG